MYQDDISRLKQSLGNWYTFINIRFSMFRAKNIFRYILLKYKINVHVLVLLCYAIAMSDKTYKNTCSSLRKYFH